jgi:hypothetical protein
VLNPLCGPPLGALGLLMELGLDGVGALRGAAVTRFRLFGGGVRGGSRSDVPEEGLFVPRDGDSRGRTIGRFN